MSQEQMSPAVLASSDSLDSVRQQLHELRPSKQGDKAVEDTKARKACQDFEAVFIGQLWKQMRASVPKDGILDSKEQEQYVSMFDQEISVKMARSGGIGLGDMLYSSLQDRLKNASKDTSSPKALEPLHVAARQATGATQAESVPTMQALTAMQQAEMLAQSIIKAHETGVVGGRQSVAVLEDGLSSTDTGGM